MRGEEGRGIDVEVLVDEGRLRLVTGGKMIGDWEVSQIGIHALNEGFAIRVEGEELVLRTDDDAGVAESLGLLTSSPRLARKVAASHPPEERPAPPEEQVPPSQLGAIALALGGALVLVGGIILGTAGVDAGTPGAAASFAEGRRYWAVFVVGGLVITAAAYLSAIGWRWARLVAAAALLGVVVLFISSVQGGSITGGQLFGYSFIAGGFIVGVAVVFGGALTRGY